MGPDTLLSIKLVDYAYEAGARVIEDLELTYEDLKTND